MLFLISRKRPSVTVIAPIYTSRPPLSHPSPLCWAVNHSPPLNGGRLLPVHPHTCRTHAVNRLLLISHPWRQIFTFVMAGLIFFSINIFNVFIQWSVFLYRLSVVVNAVSLSRAGKKHFSCSEHRKGSEVIINVYMTSHTITVNMIHYARLSLRNIPEVFALHFLNIFWLIQYTLYRK